MAGQRIGDGAYADLKGGAIPARALVWRATEGWEAEVFDYSRASPHGLQRIWGPERHPEKDVAMRAAEAAARQYAADQKTAVEWVEFR